ncbi:coatomer subunit gammma [Guillardia theta CCMP2712]|uniref:Coatomer subunit gamma n=1 Tax=Guillardia theta (strain CCMP2712) TaxID=905079 RepID=L1JUP8_GUITC|nr:coatomer subunit gammma [Guillardia theta CCMP2712]EKX51930.1 coatomer subunit gammma [Guillardia theta CCMP2712]|eukprot:XP_005838910.1 coatomer subunit gammma [Guillardia theta CCMP2712]
MSFPSEKKDDDEGLGYERPFRGVDKAHVIQEARMFNDPNVEPARCIQLMTKLLYLLGKGENFSSKESTESIFFPMTKLFQSKDEKLRRMMYLVIKELKPDSDCVIIVTSTLTKDMNATNDLFRANAIRVLCTITDTAMLTAIERYLKQAIVDKQPLVASAALVAGMKLMKSNPDVVKRWAANDKSSQMVQYHALSLLYNIKKSDRLAVSKLVAQLSKTQLKSPLAQCLLIRYTVTVMAEGNTQDRSYYEFLENCLRHRSEMVIFEAARAICQLPNVSQRELTPAITVLQLFLSSPKPSLRFAAVRALNRVAMAFPLTVTSCNLDLENMISDSNRSIATLAITTLLKTGSESSVDRLMKQISSFMSEIADEFKIMVVDAIRALCLKYPQKHRVLINFLSTILREEGGFEFKKAITDTMLALINDIPDAVEPGLLHLCEFIEDCEFTYLSTQILHVLGKRGPKTSHPGRYIRHIYNRIILENATVRSAAVTSLAKFGAQVPSLRSNIITLLRRCVHDADDEVRDRSTFYGTILASESEPMIKKYIVDVVPHKLDGVQKAIEDYIEASDFTTSFNFAKAVTMPIHVPTKEAKKTPQQAVAEVAANAGSSIASKRQETGTIYADLLNQIPEFAGFGALFTSSPPVNLTESEAEYVVTCIKHVFPEHIVFHFNIKNTMEEEQLENVCVELDLSDCPGCSFVASIPSDAIKFEQPGMAYVAIRRTKAMANMFLKNCKLTFVRKEYDPTSGEVAPDGDEDDYPLDEIEVGLSDYTKPLSLPDFRSALEKYKSISDAVVAIQETLGMDACENSASVSSAARQHRLLLSGVLLGELAVLVRADLRTSASNVVEMKLMIRSQTPEVSEAVLEAVSS